MGQSRSTAKRVLTESQVHRGWLGTTHDQFTQGSGHLVPASSEDQQEVALASGDTAGCFPPFSRERCIPLYNQRFPESLCLVEQAQLVPVGTELFCQPRAGSRHPPRQEGPGISFIRNL